MENRKLSMIATVVVVFMGAIPSARPEAANEFQSNGTKCNWNDGSLWSLGHLLKKSEQPVFKADGSVVEIDDEIPISCNVYIGAKNLTMQGKGVLDLVNPALARSSIYIPSDGFSCANLTVRGNLSINARIILAESSANKGTLTLRDNALVKGRMQIGSEDGSGSGQVFVYDNASLHITDLACYTQANRGGVAEIHIEGGNVLINGKRAVRMILDDPSVHIIVGAAGTLHILRGATESRNQTEIDHLLERNIFPAENCRLKPEYDDTSIVITAVAIAIAPAARNTIASGAPSTTPAVEKIFSPAPSVPVKAVDVQKRKAVAATGLMPLAGYMVFSGILLLLIRPPTPGEAKQ